MVEVRTGENSVILVYQHVYLDGSKVLRELPVDLSWMPCHFGGQRPWFICPNPDCGRRVAILYRGYTFACRRCRDLVFESQRESPGDRILRKANKIRERLGWRPGFASSMDGRPKGMHFRTYDRLLQEYIILQQSYFKGLLAWQEKMNDIIRKHRG